MKKKYRKPMACVERFDIVQTNAGRDCWDSIVKEQVTLSDVPCAWDFEGVLFFNTQVLNTDCKEDGNDLGLVCYNNPTDKTLMFRS